MKLTKSNVTKDQSRDTGMAIILLLLLVFLASKREGYLIVAIMLQVLNMTVPQMYRPVAMLWLGISELLGNLVSKILLSILFFVVVTPIAIVRRIMRRDSLKLRSFKASEDSVLVERNHMFGGLDMEKPY